MSFRKTSIVRHFKASLSFVLSFSLAFAPQFARADNTEKTGAEAVSDLILSTSPDCENLNKTGQGDVSGQTLQLIGGFQFAKEICLNTFRIQRGILFAKTPFGQSDTLPPSAIPQIEKRLLEWRDDLQRRLVGIDEHALVQDKDYTPWLSEIKAYFLILAFVQKVKALAGNEPSRAAIDTYALRAPLGNHTPSGLVLAIFLMASQRSDARIPFTIDLNPELTEWTFRLKSSSFFDIYEYYLGRKPEMRNLLEIAQYITTSTLYENQFQIHNLLLRPIGETPDVLVSQKQKYPSLAFKREALLDESEANFQDRVREAVVNALPDSLTELHKYPEGYFMSAEFLTQFSAALYNQQPSEEQVRNSLEGEQGLKANESYFVQGTTFPALVSAMNFDVFRSDQALRKRLERILLLSKVRAFALIFYTNASLPPGFPQSFSTFLDKRIQSYEEDLSRMPDAVFEPMIAAIRSIKREDVARARLITFAQSLKKDSENLQLLLADTNQPIQYDSLLSTVADQMAQDQFFILQNNAAIVELVKDSKTFIEAKEKYFENLKLILSTGRQFLPQNENSPESLIAAVNKASFVSFSVVSQFNSGSKFSKGLIATAEARRREDIINLIQFGSRMHFFDLRDQVGKEPKVADFNFDKKNLEVYHGHVKDSVLSKNPFLSIKYQEYLPFQGPRQPPKGPTVVEMLGQKDDTARALWEKLLPVSGESMVEVVTRALRVLEQETRASQELVAREHSRFQPTSLNSWKRLVGLKTEPEDFSYEFKKIVVRSMAIRTRLQAHAVFDRSYRRLINEMGINAPAALAWDQFFNYYTMTGFALWLGSMALSRVAKFGGSFAEYFMRFFGRSPSGTWGLAARDGIQKFEAAVLFPSLGTNYSFMAGGFALALFGIQSAVVNPFWSQVDPETKEVHPGLIEEGQNITDQRQVFYGSNGQIITYKDLLYAEDGYGRNQSYFHGLAMLALFPFAILLIPLAQKLFLNNMRISKLTRSLEQNMFVLGFQKGQYTFRPEELKVALDTTLRSIDEGRVIGQIGNPPLKFDSSARGAIQKMFLKAEARLAYQNVLELIAQEIRYWDDLGKEFAPHFKKFGLKPGQWAFDDIAEKYHQVELKYKQGNISFDQLISYRISFTQLMGNMPKIGNVITETAVNPIMAKLYQQLKYHRTLDGRPVVVEESGSADQLLKDFVEAAGLKVKTTKTSDPDIVVFSFDRQNPYMYIERPNFIERLKNQLKRQPKASKAAE